MIKIDSLQSPARGAFFVAIGFALRATRSFSPHSAQRIARSSLREAHSARRAASLAALKAVLHQQSCNTPLH
jgi:hypothetical protein